PSAAPHRPREHPWREILNGLFYITRAGCAWRRMPCDLPHWKIVYHYFRLGVRGYDAGKKVKGCKRHLLVDTQGLSKRLSHLFVDGGYKRRFEEWVRRTLGWTVEVVRRPDANFRVIHRYNQGLPMKNLRHENKGRAPLVPPKLQEPFRQAHPRDGLWSIRNAAEWLAERLGRPVDARRAWYWMRRLGLAPLRHREADAKRQEAFKKSSF
ncbi:transposase, partial [Meiothermus luteus]